MTVHSSVFIDHGSHISYGNLPLPYEVAVTSSAATINLSPILRTFTPQDVVLADNHSQPYISSPSTSDDPSTPTSPSLPPSTSISAPTTPHQHAQPPLRLDTADPGTNTSLRETETEARPSSSQILGRRRRQTSLTLEEQEGLLETVGDPEGLQQAGTQHRRKRRRLDPRMRYEGETASSNGTSRPFSNGSGPSPLHKVAISNSTNGTRRSSVAMNGSSTTNGHSNLGSKPRTSYFGHDREEVTRILIQAVADLGYHTAAANLAEESGYDLESSLVTAFRNAVLKGEWNEAENLLFGEPTEEGGVSINSSGLTLREGIDMNIVRFWLRQQKFLELLELRDTGRALAVLRLELTPLYQDTGKLHFLSSLLMCQSTDDLRAKAEWDGAEGQSRRRLLSDLSKCIAPSVMLPERRLAVLLQQVKQNQISKCIYHNTLASPSLYQDHICDRSNFPSRAILELDKHTGQVWQVKFSHDGSRLATCGEDGTTVIYDVATFEVLQVLADHESGVGSLAWSPDDSLIVTCAQDRRARTGSIIRTLARFGEPVSSCVWAPDGNSFVTGCLDKERNLCQWSLSGELIYDWGRSHRIQDLAVTPNGNRLIAMGHERHIFVYNFITRELEYEMDFGVNLCSLGISQNSRYLLINQTDAKTRLFDINTRETLHIFSSGGEPGRNAIRSTFGGANESFVVSGSETGYIYIYHRENGTLIDKLQHHKSGCCNAVSWNPTNPYGQIKRDQIHRKGHGNQTDLMDRKKNLMGGNNSESLSMHDIHS
ncbi:hypothetical protein B7494_g4927 [Chlorociboria aeruginascens]|nr:hypothetical protein B7494_g4927 [Chlorociboria aeruginascens]